jgi:hypothetical protein
VGDHGQVRLMRTVFLTSTAVLLACCSKPNVDKGMFIRVGEAKTPGDPGPAFLADALARLTPPERAKYRRLGHVGGFLFEGQKYTCIAIVSLRADVIDHASTPAFCYDKVTNRFVERL